MRIHNLTPLLSILFSQFARSQYCYYPGANAQAQGHRPCDAHAVTSLCCPIGWACFSNKLCVVTDANAVNHTAAAGTSIRGTCTDPRWNSTVCGDFCLSECHCTSNKTAKLMITDEPVNDNDGSLVPCGNNVFACSPEARNGLANCAVGKGVFSLTQGTLQTIIGQVGTSSTATPSVTVSSAAATTTRSSTSTSHASSSPTPSTAPARHKSKVGVIVGPTVAVVAIICIVVGALLWCYPKNKRTITATNADNTNPAAPFNYGAGDDRTFASEVSTLAPYPHPYSPSSSPPPQQNRSQTHVFGHLGVQEDDPYHQAFKSPPQVYSPPPPVYNVPRRGVGEGEGVL
jgi:hypothetical protein